MARPLSRIGTLAYQNTAPSHPAALQLVGPETACPALEHCRLEATLSLRFAREMAAV